MPNTENQAVAAGSLQHNPEFHSNFHKNWESRSSVRTRPRKCIDFSLPHYFFPEEKQPLLLAPAIQSLGVDIKREILQQTFYKYLHDIINLEIKFIIKVCNRIIYDNLPVAYEEQDKLAAYLITIDEYYHVYNAKDMQLQMQRHFKNLGDIAFPTSDAQHAILHICETLEPKYHGIFEIIAVCIFETTLVKELVESFNSKDVHPSIRYYVSDHMNDESRHYGYFFTLLKKTWQQLPLDYRRDIGKQMANFITLYLNIESEKAFNTNLLSKYLSDKAQIYDIVGKLYQGFAISPQLPIVKNVFGILQRTGVLSDRFVQQSFIAKGWEHKSFSDSIEL